MLLFFNIYTHMKAKNILIGSMVFLSVFSVTSAHNHMEAETTMMESTTIVDIAVGNEDFSTLVTAVVEAELAETLASEGPFTVFAPLNSAFAALPEGIVDTLLMPDNRELLQSVLTYHVLAGDVRASALQRGLSVATLQGSEVRFEMNGGNWYINGAQIVATDIVADNGVIHVIDSVILPPADTETMETQKDMLEEILSADEMSLIMNFDRALQNLLSQRSERVQTMLINRVLSTLDIALSTKELSMSQQNMLTYIKLHIELM